MIHISHSIDQVLMMSADLLTIVVAFVIDHSYSHIELDRMADAIALDLSAFDLYCFGNNGSSRLLAHSWTSGFTAWPSAASAIASSGNVGYSA